MIDSQAIRVTSVYIFYEEEEEEEAATKIMMKLCVFVTYKKYPVKYVNHFSFYNLLLQ